MPLSEHLPTLLNAEQLPELWHRSYGLTAARRNSLTAPPMEKKSYRNSFLNPKSETACTLFMLGRMDNWVQAPHAGTTPRNQSGWDSHFFDKASQEDFGERESWCFTSPFRLWIAELLGVTAEQTADAVLLFECEMRNSALCVGNALCPVSFLDTTQKSWCLQDAIVLLPKIQRLVVIESKLGSDMSRDTQEFSLVSQAIRGWESAFMLTRRPESRFCGWSFQSILLCPRKPFEYRAAYYSYVFSDPEDHVARYRRILECEYPRSLHRQRFDQHFEEFQQSISDATVVAHWDEIAQLISHDDDGLSSYLTRIQEACESDGEAVFQAAVERLRLAGVECNDAHGQ